MAARDFNAVDLRRGRYAAAQLWKLATVKGVYLELGELVAPFLGDVYAVVPHDIAVLSRRLGRLAIPREIPRNIQQVRVRVFADEVAGEWDLPVQYTTVQDFPNARRGVLPRTAGIYDHFCAEIRFTPPLAFEADWEERFGVEWPMVRVDGHLEIHPALVELWARAVDIEGLIVQNNERRLAVAHRQHLHRLLPAHLADSPAFVDLVREMNIVHP